MAAISTEQVKKLRDETGIAVMQCRKALEEAGGDFEKARLILRKKSADAALKKADRSLGAGIVQAYIHGNFSVGAMVELACETDFVSGNEEFRRLAYEIAMHAAALGPEYLRPEDVPESDRKKMAEVFEKEVAGKPPAIRAKVLESKLAAHFGERTLLDQPFVKNGEVTVRELLAQAIQKFGEKIEVVRFVRFRIGGA